MKNSKKRLALLLVLAMVASMVLTACGQPVATGLELGDMPTKTSYVAGEVFDKTGMTVYVTYSDGTRVVSNDYTVDKTVLTASDTFVTVSASGFTLNVPVAVSAPDAVAQNHIIKDEQGNYGGTLNKTKYGEGAPFNGEYDVENSPYFAKNDYYYMQSTETRTLISGFETYQKTMKDSSGIACLLSIMHRDGYDVFDDDLNEEAMVQKYEELNNTTVYGNGTTPQGLKNLFVEMGYSAQANVFTMNTALAINEETRRTSVWLKDKLDEGKFMLVRFQDAEEFGWHIILGVDDMGTTDWARDDVIILADPNDGADHCQDGYYTMSLARFYRWWEEVKYSSKEDKFVAENQFDIVVVTPEKPITYVVGPETMLAQTAYERHMILNADGSFGGTTDKNLYGSGQPLNGQYDRPDLNYQKIVDVYNLQSTQTRTILSNFVTFQQTMASSCALVSLMVTLNYYGYDVVNQYSEVAIVDAYQTLHNVNITGQGTNASKRVALLQSWGFTAESNQTTTTKQYRFPTYQSFVEFATGHLSLGRPIPIAWTPIGNHGVVLIGYESMGTDYIYDDVVFIADSADNWDNYTDGYNVVSAPLFFRNYYGNADPGKSIYAQQYNVFWKD